MLYFSAFENEIIVEDSSLSALHAEVSTTIRGRQTILGLAERCFQQVSHRPSPWRQALTRSLHFNSSPSVNQLIVFYK